MRVVLDTNVLVSSMIQKQGNPAWIMRRWEQGVFDLLVSPESLSELDRVLTYPRIQKRLKSCADETEAVVFLIKTESILVEPDIHLSVVTDDPADNRYLELAVCGSARYLVTGDNHLLAITRYRGIDIVTPAVFVQHRSGENIR